MIWFFVGSTVGTFVGFVIASVLTSGKMFDEAKAAYNEGYRLGKMEGKSAI